MERSSGTMAVSWIRVILVLTSVNSIVSQTNAFTQLNQYCDDESFEPKCEEGESIIMSSARFGRMTTGKCVEKRYDHMPCSENVIGHLDAWCSGRQACQRDVSDLNKKVQPCPRDFRSYLEASYYCVPVINSDVQCSQGTTTVVRASSGYISRQVAFDTNCGTIDSPWLIQVKPGQRINVTLFDFGIALLGASHVDKDDVCLVYATIKETAGTVSKTVCGGQARESHIYTSITNQIAIRLMGNQQESADEEVHYLLRYQAIGCPDPVFGPGSWFRRYGEHEATVGCDGSSEEWRLTCKDMEWIGEHENCSNYAGVGHTAGSTDSMTSTGIFPKGVAIVIMVGIAVCVGLVILLVGIICLKRRRQRNEESGPYHTAVIADTYHSPDAYKEAGSEGYSGSGNDYYRTWQMQQHAGRTGPGVPPHPSLPLPPPLRESSREYFVDHEYESPKFENEIHFPERIPADSGHPVCYNVEQGGTQPRRQANSFMPPSPSDGLALQRAGYFDHQDGRYST